jgi:hypothetical protein
LRSKRLRKREPVAALAARASEKQNAAFPPVGKEREAYRPARAGKGVQRACPLARAWAWGQSGLRKQAACGRVRLASAPRSNNFSTIPRQLSSNSSTNFQPNVGQTSSAPRKTMVSLLHRKAGCSRLNPGEVRGHAATLAVVRRMSGRIGGKRANNKPISFPLVGKGAKRRGQRERMGSPEGLPFGAGLGRREAQPWPPAGARRGHRLGRRAKQIAPIGRERLRSRVSGRQASYFVGWRLAAVLTDERRQRRRRDYGRGLADGRRGGRASPAPLPAADKPKANEPHQHERPKPHCHQTEPTQGIPPDGADNEAEHR